MTLTQYLDKNRIDRNAFAKLMQVDLTTLYRWETNKRFPRRHIHAIMAETKNQVTANDFLDALKSEAA